MRIMAPASVARAGPREKRSAQGAVEGLLQLDEVDEVLDVVELGRVDAHDGPQIVRREPLFVELVQAPEVLFVATNDLLANQDGLLGVQLGYSLGLGRLLITPALRALTKQVNDAELRYRFLQLDLLVDIGAAVVAQQRIDVTVGAQLAAIYFQQRFGAINQRKHSVGARIAASFGLRIHLVADVDLLLRLALGVSVITRNGSIVAPFHSSGALGLGVRF